MKFVNDYGAGFLQLDTEIYNTLLDTKNAMERVRISLKIDKGLFMVYLFIVWVIYLFLFR